MSGELWRTATPVGPPDRAVLRAELEATRDAFHGLVGRLSPADWRRKSSVPDWTVGEVAVHVTVYLTTVIPRGVSFARAGRRGGGFPPAIAHSPIGDWLNTAWARWLARRETPESLLRVYDAAHDDVLRLLDSVGDVEWTKTTYTLGRRMSVHELFHVHPVHFLDHAAQLEQAGGRSAQNSNRDALG
jgi:hypothetical protein